MAQPVAGDSWKNLGTVGTVVVTDRGCVLKRILYLGTYVGSVAFYDCSGTAGTSATNLIYTAGLPAQSAPNQIDLFAQTRYGLVYASTGTPSITFTWE
jgi:hypothetical protein